MNDTKTIEKLKTLANADENITFEHFSKVNNNLSSCKKLNHIPDSNISQDTSLLSCAHLNLDYETFDISLNLIILEKKSENTDKLSSLLKKINNIDFSNLKGIGCLDDYQCLIDKVHNTKLHNVNSFHTYTTKLKLLNFQMEEFLNVLNDLKFNFTDELVVDDSEIINTLEAYLTNIQHIIESTSKLKLKKNTTLNVTETYSKIHNMMLNLQPVMNNVENAINVFYNKPTCDTVSTFERVDTICNIIEPKDVINTNLTSESDADTICSVENELICVDLKGTVNKYEMKINQDMEQINEYEQLQCENKLNTTLTSESGADTIFAVENEFICVDLKGTVNTYEMKINRDMEQINEYEQLQCENRICKHEGNNMKIKKDNKSPNYVVTKRYNYRKRVNTIPYKGSNLHIPLSRYNNNKRICKNANKSQNKLIVTVIIIIAFICTIVILLFFGYVNM